MRILLQQRDTSLYFRDINSWTAGAREATDFVSSTAALDFCAANKLGDVQVVLKFEGEKYEIVLPAVVPPRQAGDRPCPPA